MSKHKTRKLPEAPDDGGETDPLLPGERANFETLSRAIVNNDACLMRCQLAATGEPVAVVCAVNREGGQCEMIPVAMLFTGNPYEIVNPPRPEGGFLTQSELWGDG